MIGVLERMSLKAGNVKRRNSGFLRKPGRKRNGQRARLKIEACELLAAFFLSGGLLFSPFDGEG